MSSTYAILEFFEYEHLPSNLQDISRPFCELAVAMVAQVPCEPGRFGCNMIVLDVVSGIGKMVIVRFSGSPGKDNNFIRRILYHPPGGLGDYVRPARIRHSATDER